MMERALELDNKDPLRSYRDKFLGSDDPSITAYLDGNSLGRPTKASVERINTFMTHAWGGRLIRGWDEQWFDLPVIIGDALADGRLKLLMPEWKVASGGLYLVTPPGRPRPARIEVLGEFLSQHLAKRSWNILP